MYFFNKRCARQETAFLSTSVFPASRRTPGTEKDNLKAVNHIFFPRTVRDWNRHVPVLTRTAKDLDGFKAALPTYNNTATLFLTAF